MQHDRKTVLILTDYPKLQQVGKFTRHPTGFGIVGDSIIKAVQNAISDNTTIIVLCWNMIQATEDIIGDSNIKYLSLKYGDRNFEFISKIKNMYKPELIIFHNDLDYFSLYNIKAQDSYTHNNVTIWLGPVDTNKRTKEFDMFNLNPDREGNIFIPYTEHGRDILDNSICNIPMVYKLGPTPGMIKYNNEIKKNNSFLTVGAARTKKRMDHIVASYLEYFKTHKDSTLTIKTNHDVMSENILKYNLKNGINVITEDYSLEQMSKLYATHETYISATANEGWGIPLSDATHYNMNIIAPDFKVHDESTGGIYSRIDYMNFNIFDGWRSIPVHNMKQLSELMEIKKPNDLKINHWDESMQQLTKLLISL